MAKPRIPKKLNGEATLPPPEVSSATPPAMQASVTESTLTENKTARKPSIIRSETRANLVPINVEEEIRRFAYLLAERRGFIPGHETEDWLTAEREIRQRYHQQQSA